MEFRNVLMAIVLSTVVLIGWATFFEAPIVEQQTVENEITKNEDLSSPSIDKEEAKSEIISQPFFQILIHLFQIYTSNGLLTQLLLWVL